MKIGSDKELLLRNMMNAPGGDPVYILDMLYEVITSEVWKTWTQPPYERFGQALEHMGQTWDKVTHLVAIHHPGETRGELDVLARMAYLRSTIKTMHDMEIEAVANQENTGRGKTSYMSEVSKMGGNSRDYTIARLKRDNPEIAELVVRGDISAAEGRRQAGWEPHRVAIRLDDPISAARTIRKHMNQQAVNELIVRLYEEANRPSESPDDSGGDS